VSSSGYSSPDSAPSPGACGRLTFLTTVNSVDAAVAAGVSGGDVLDVVLVGTAPTRRVEVRTPFETLGSITQNWAQLVECLEGGWTYQAVVLNVGPPLRVRVEPT
jgi:hypothetical protein